MVSPARHTRRRVLALGAAAGLTATLRPTLAAAAIDDVAAFSVDVGTLPAGRPTPVLRAGRRFALAGVGGAGLRQAGVELRARRRGGTWTPWTTVGSGDDHAPDDAGARGTSDPIWTGPADELQLRAARTLHDVRALLVSAPPSPARARARLRDDDANGPPPITPRAGWDAAAAPIRAAPAFGEVRMAFVHHTESANAYGPDESPGIVLSIARYHIDHNGWNDIGYNFLVDRYGQIFEGRAGGVDQAVIGAHAQGWNSQSTGIAAIGSFMSTGFPEAGTAALARILAYKLSLHGVTATGTSALASGGGPDNRYPAGRVVTLRHISGHRDGCSTDCPGTVLYGDLGALRSRVAKLQQLLGNAPHMTLSTVTPRVGYGRAASVRGRVSAADNLPLAAAPVVVQKRGATGFVTVASATTAADGTWSTTIPWRRAGTVRAVATAPDATKIVSPQITIGIVAQLTVGTPGPASRIRAGRATRIAGEVRPGGPVSIVVEREDASGTFVRVGVVKARVRGQGFGARVPLAKPGLYRLSARSGTGPHAARSATVLVRAARRG